MQSPELFEAIAALLHSPVAGEAEAAFGKFRALGPKHGWPTVAELVERCRATVPLERHQELERERDGWVKAYRAMEVQVKWLKLANGVLRATVWVRQNWKRKLLKASLAGIVGYVMFTLAVPYVRGGDLGLAESDLKAIAAKQSWVIGDTKAAVFSAGGADYWIIFRGTKESDTHADRFGKQVIRRCIAVFAARAVGDEGVYLTPDPYSWIGLIKWPQYATDCRISED